MKKLIAAFTVLFFAAAAWAELRIDPVFTSNMVLQQERPIAFFGTADPGAEVKVGFAGKNVSVRAGTDGKWRAEFPAMKAGSTNYTVKITDGKKTIGLNDVLIGEVWFCSGQSNMQLPVGRTFLRGRSAMNAAQETAAANWPEIRFAQQGYVCSHNKELPAQYGKSSGWVKCSPETVWFFSAAAYFFGRQLHQDLKVPVGLIHASRGGTRIQTWISDAGYEEFGPASDLAIVKKFRLTDAEKKEFEEKAVERFTKAMTEWHALFAKAGAKAAETAKDWANPGLDDSGWKPAAEAVTRTYLVRWFRCKFKTPPASGTDRLRLVMGIPGCRAAVYLNGKLIASREPCPPKQPAAIQCTIEPGQLDPSGDNVLAVRCEYYYGPAARRQMLFLLRQTLLVRGKERIALNSGWKMKDEFSCTPAQTARKKAPFFDVPYSSHQFHSNLYNAMASAWTRLPVRGVIWYQGCANNGQMHYYPLHKTLIADWRARWNDPEMPFLIVQLAGYEPARAKNWQTADPNTPSGFALTRDIQQQMLKLPNVGLATAIDIGEAANIHPGNKQEVGRRLALEAERIAYGRNLVSRGPLFLSATPENGALRVAFRYADNGLKTSDGKAPGAFAIAGADGKFVWADAKIDGKTVLVCSPKVKDPKYVRYAYMGYRGDCNLQNAEGLPAYPFRSDAVDYSREEPNLKPVGPMAK